MIDLRSAGVALTGLRTKLEKALRPPRFHAYCVGTAKSGTHSVAGMFEDRYRAAHEPEDEDFLGLFLEVQAGRTAPEELVQAVHCLQDRLRLELNSSSFNFWLLDILQDEFPDAKFILTIREARSWLDSFINHQLSRACSDNWLKMREMRFRPDEFRHPAEERVLARHGLYTLDAYLSYWARHNTEVLRKIPGDRLFVLRTEEISSRMAELARFVGVPVETLNSTKSRAYAAAQKFDILADLDPDYLSEKLEQHCGPVLSQFFPDRSMA